MSGISSYFNSINLIVIYTVLFLQFECTIRVQNHIFSKINRVKYNKMTSCIGK